MLSKILSKETCAKCRICCAFDKDDIWEVPLGVDTESPDESGLFKCSELGDKGCKLGENKPFECRVWPFRIMEYYSNYVITVSPVCPSIYSKPLNEIMNFINSEKLIDYMMNYVKEHKDVVKPYIEGYPIVYITKKEA